MKQSIDTNSFTILIVDDEPKNIQLLANILTKNMYDIEFATNGEEALDWARNKRFDLILLDIMMPGQNGYEICQQIREEPDLAHIPVIFLTAKSSPEDIARGFESGGSDYITKPFNTPELLARIKMQVEMKILRGILPICASCKDIRNDEGVWSRIDSYLQANSLALFSHSLCPGCAEKLYGNETWFVNRP